MKGIQRGRLRRSAPADDAVVIDTSEMNVESAVAAVLAHIWIMLSSFFSEVENALYNRIHIL